ncbi:hypothetical protein [Azospirillum sp. B510]|uniref:hypothetical protein n=1 Tax=Azospirillum sp. (strain B510) TaxID=137722 RepID=UPI000304A53B|nr:hypothetical protein [Azospirillum sp. B510]
MHSSETESIVHGRAIADGVALGRLGIGETASMCSRFTAMEAELCGVLAGDLVHSGGETRSADPVPVSDLWLHGLVSRVLETSLPGAGGLHRTQHLDVARPVEAEEVVTATVTIVAKRSAPPVIILACDCVGADGGLVASGSVEIPIPSGRPAAPAEPAHHATGRHGYRDLLAGCAGLPPLRVAVVEPCDAATLTTAVTAAEAGLIEPVLIGPAARICAVAALCHLDIRPYHLIGADHAATAEVAATLARIGKVGAIMLGSADDEEMTSALVETLPRSPDSLRLLGLKASIVQGAAVPVLFAGKADDLDARLASCAIISRLAASRGGRPLAA